MQVIRGSHTSLSRSHLKANMIKREELIEIGKFQKTHALKGELNALLDVDAEFASEGHALIVEMDGIFVPFFTESVRPKGAESCLIKLKGIDTQENARELVNKEIYGLREELKEFFGDEERESAGDFVGYTINDRGLGAIGTITDIDFSTANVLFIVDGPKEETLYIPAAEEFIDSIDQEGKTIHMNLPEGLIELNEKSEK